MLRRPPTTLALTAEDVAAYEDHRYEVEKARAQSAVHVQTQALVQAQILANIPQAERALLRSTRSQAQLSTADASTSDEAMEDAVPGPGFDDDDDEDDNHVESSEDDEDDDDPFTQRHLRRAALGRDVSPTARHTASARELRARGGHSRSQSHQVTSGEPSATPAAAPTGTTTRSQRIMGTTAAPTPATTLPPTTTPQPSAYLQTPVAQAAPATGMGMSTRARGSRQISEPPPAPARQTRSRDERIASTRIVDNIMAPGSSRRR